MNIRTEKKCRCDYDLAQGCPANPDRIYGNDGSVGLCESGDESPWSPDGPGAHREDPPYAPSVAQSGRMLLRVALAVAPEARRLDLIAQVGKGLLDSLDRPLKHVPLAEIEHTKGILSWLRDQYREEQKSEGYQAVIASAIARGRTA